MATIIPEVPIPQAHSAENLGCLDSEQFLGAGPPTLAVFQRQNRTSKRLWKEAGKAEFQDTPSDKVSFKTFLPFFINIYKMMNRCSHIPPGLSREHTPSRVPDQSTDVACGGSQWAGGGGGELFVFETGSHISQSGLNCV